MLREKEVSRGDKKAEKRFGGTLHESSKKGRKRRKVERKRTNRTAWLKKARGDQPGNKGGRGQAMRSVRNCLEERGMPIPIR